MHLSKFRRLRFTANNTRYEVDMSLVNRDETVDMRITLVNGQQFIATHIEEYTVIELEPLNGPFGGNMPL